jgi:hypothetical protein
MLVLEAVPFPPHRAAGVATRAVSAFYEALSAKTIYRPQPERSGRVRRDGIGVLDRSGRRQSTETGRCGAALFAAQEAANGLMNLAPSGRGASGHPVLVLPQCMLAMRPSRRVRLSRHCDWVQRAVLAVPSRFFLRRSASSLVVIAAALAGCALNEGPGQLAVDPGRYEFYHCGDLATRLTVLQARETELRTLMAKAGEGGSGALVGALAYRADYETVLSEEKLLQRTAAEKKCEVGPPPAFQSGQTVR